MPNTSRILSLVRVEVHFFARPTVIVEIILENGSIQALYIKRARQSAKQAWDVTVQQRRSTVMSRSCVALNEGAQKTIDDLKNEILPSTASQDTLNALVSKGTREIETVARTLAPRQELRHISRAQRLRFSNIPYYSFLHDESHKFIVRCSRETCSVCRNWRRHNKCGVA